VEQSPVVFVTVGMGRWPFDRLLSAVSRLPTDFRVFVQSGTSSVDTGHEQQPFLSFAETLERIAQADVIITHGGNTVRLVQRLGKIPIVVAREAARGEMPNDHQVVFVRSEVDAGRIIAASGDSPDLAEALARHQRSVESMSLALQSLPPVDVARLPERIDSVLNGAGVGGYAVPELIANHPLRRYRWAWGYLAGRHGRHLELGLGDGTFVRQLVSHSDLNVVGIDPHPDYVRAVREGCPTMKVVRTDALPFADCVFDSATLMDTLEHVRDEHRTLRELHRVLKPGGLLLVTVPGRHLLSGLDPDNAKFHHPRLHAAVYRLRFGSRRYRKRFVDNSDGLRGDMAWSRTIHTNYEPSDLMDLLRETGFRPFARDGSNLFWRLLQVPQLVAPARLAALLERPIRWDADHFHQANVFVAAERR